MHKHITRIAAISILSLGPIAPAVWAQNTVETIAGGGPNDLPALKSSLGSPATVALDGAGNVYVGDLYSGRVLRIGTTGNVTVVAGTGAHGGSNGTGGPAIGAFLAYPSGVAVDSSGDIFIADRSFCMIREISAHTGIISIVAGTFGTCGYSGDGGPATSAQLNNPSGVAVDTSGDIIIADTDNCLIREVSGSTGVISTLAGTLPDVTGGLHCGYSGDGGLGTSAKVGFANDLSVDALGNVIVADTTNCAVRKISLSNGFISTLAGTGTCGYSGDGGPAVGALLNQPFGLAVDSSGNIFIADTSNCVVRKISSPSADISTIAGNNPLGCGYSGDGASATGAQLNEPYGVAVESSGAILIADYKNSVIRRVATSTGNISTFAGVAVPNPIQTGQLFGFPAYSGDGYLATDAELGFFNTTPYGGGLATDASGNAFIVDTFNDVIREVSASTGVITTVAGDGFLGYSGDGGPATSAELFAPRDVAVDDSGNIFIVDSGNCLIRKVTASTGVITTVAGTPPDSSGNYYCGFSGDGGPATSAQLFPIFLATPAGGVAVDNSGNIFIADTGNSVIREVSASTGIITTVVGIANDLYVGGGDGGPATSGTLNNPFGIAVDRSGNLFIADTFDYEIREVTAVNGNIYTVAGTLGLTSGLSGFGGPAGSAQLGDIFNLYLDPAGNLFIPDPDICAVLAVSGSTGVISVVAGTPSGNGYFCGFSGDGGPALTAVFDNPSAVGAGTGGDLVVLDETRVRTVAGLVKGPAASAVPFPDPLGFPGTALGTSLTLTEILNDRGALPTSVSTVTVSGTNASDFSETDDCAGQSLAGGGGSCVVNVKFSPSVVGTESASLTFADTAGTQNVGLSGTGLSPPGFSPSSQTIAFGNQQETVKSVAMNLTVTNNGNSPLTITAVVVSGANASDFSISGNNCTGASMAISSTCSVSATFTPSTTGPETALLNFTDNAPGNPQSVALTGTGTDFSISLAPGASATATVAPGTLATYNLEIAPVSGFNGTVALSCTGAPADSSCTPSETSATPNGTAAATFTVQVTTAAPSIVSPDVGRPWWPFNGLGDLTMALVLALFSALLAFLSLFRASSAQQRRAYAVVIPLSFLLLAFILVGCGGGSSTVTPPPSGGTPAGNYTLTITGTSNGVSQSQTLTLTVN
jgi:trimeric autotransporter adhesin